MAIKQNVEVAENNYQVDIRVPLILEKDKVDDDGYAVQYHTRKNKGHQWILYLTTFVTVCGSFAFGSCVRVLFTSCIFLFPQDSSNMLIEIMIKSIIYTFVSLFLPDWLFFAYSVCHHRRSKADFSRGWSKSAHSV